MIIWKNIVAAFRWFNGLSFVDYLRILAVVLFSVSVLAFYNWTRLTESVVAIEAGSANARATVTRALQDRRRRVVSVYYEFADRHGAEHAGSQNNVAMQRSLKAGDFVDIIYGRQAPQHSAIELPTLKQEAETKRNAGWIFLILSVLALLPYHRLKRFAQGAASP